MTDAPTSKIVPRDEWERARAELLVREKAHTRAGDELAAARRRLPMTRMEPVMVVGPDGPVALHDVFEGRRIFGRARHTLRRLQQRTVERDRRLPRLHGLDAAVVLDRRLRRRAGDTKW